MTEVVGSKSAKHLKRWRLIVLVAIVVIIVAGVGFYLFNLAQKRPAVQIGTGAEVGALVSVLPPEQLEQVASVYVLNPAQDMDWAYAKAVALSTQGEQDKALSAFRALTKTGKAEYYIYVDYALAARRAGDKQLAIDTMTQAISILDRDTSINKSNKEFIKKRLVSKLDSFKTEDAQ